MAFFLVLAAAPGSSFARSHSCKQQPPPWVAPAGTCPFGTSCFYRHAFKDGRLEVRKPCPPLGMRWLRWDLGAENLAPPVALAAARVPKLSGALGAARRAAPHWLQCVGRSLGRQGALVGTPHSHITGPGVLYAHKHSAWLAARRAQQPHFHHLRCSQHACCPCCGPPQEPSLRKAAVDEGEVRVLQPVRLSDFLAASSTGQQLLGGRSRR